MMPLDFLGLFIITIFIVLIPTYLNDAFGHIDTHFTYNGLKSLNSYLLE